YCRTVGPARVQQQRHPAAVRQLEAGKEARIGVEQPVAAVAERMNIAEPVEDGKRVPLLEDALAIVHPRGRGVDVVLVVYIDQITRRAHLYLCRPSLPR